MLSVFSRRLYPKQITVTREHHFEQSGVKGLTQRFNSDRLVVMGLEIATF